MLLEFVPVGVVMTSLSFVVTAVVLIVAVVAVADSVIVSQ